MARAARKAQDHQAQIMSQSAAEARERRALELATTPCATGRRMVQAEDRLREIEFLAERAIHEYGITQETPAKWGDLGDLIRRLMAPIRDAARAGMKD